MSRIIKKDLETIKADLDLGQTERELSCAKIPEDNEGLDPEILSRFKPAGQRFKKLVDRKPRSQKVTIRFESQVLEYLKQDADSLGKPYQTHINDILRTYVAASRET